MNLSPHLYWFAETNYGVKFNDSEFGYGDAKKYSVVFDTGTSLTLVPDEIYKSIMNQLKKNTKLWASLTDQDGYLFGSCKEIDYWPTVYLLV